MPAPSTVLGISAYYHDSAAAVVREGELVAAAQEERFTRRKHDAAFPQAAVQYCLEHAGVRLKDLTHVVFYDKPLLKFDRLLETYFGFAPRGFASFARSMPVWVKEKLYLKNELRRILCAIGQCERDQLPPLLFTEHHHAHAASAFYPSPFETAAVLCMDGVGEWATTSAWLGNANRLTAQWQIDFPHSLGMLYSAFTYFAGFKVNSGEYKLMGLAPYGEPKYVETIRKHLIDIKDDGTFRLDMRYFDYAAGSRMTGDRFAALFDGPPRQPEAPLGQREMDLARSVQAVTEEVVLRLARTLHRELGVRHLCLAGGVALNCVANGRLLREGPFDDLWIQPAAGADRGAVGAALAGWHEYLGNARQVDARDSMHGAYLGPSAREADIVGYFDSVGAVHAPMEQASLIARVAELLAAGKVIGWYQGRMEFGPRALGARSILGDARNPRMQSTMNLKIKFRESFRPFAPVVTAEKVDAYFKLDRPSPYMLLVAEVRDELKVAIPEAQRTARGLDRLNVSRSSIPAVTHVDYSARVQTVHEHTNPKLHALLCEFERQSGCAVLVNTSFNVRGEPIVCTPEDAYQCFMRTDIDYLVIEDRLLAKVDQPKRNEDESWKKEFAAD